MPIPVSPRTLKRERDEQQARADAEERLRRFQIEQQKRDEEKAALERMYWAELEAKNAAAHKTSSPLKQGALKLSDALATCSPKGSFAGRKARLKQAKRVKVEARQRRAAEARERMKLQELERKQQELSAAGGSWQERRALTINARAADAQNEAMQRAIQKRIAEKERQEKEAEAQRMAQIKALEDKAREKREKEDHFKEMERMTHWRKSGAKHFGDLLDSPSRTVPHGYGEFFMPHGGRVYEGNYDAGRMSGEGLYEWENGDTWEGTFVDDEMQGIGVLTTDTGKATERKRWCFYVQSRRVAWLDEMHPGMRVVFRSARMTGRATEPTERSGTLMRPATTDVTAVAFRKGTWLVKMDGAAGPEWRDIARQHWHPVTAHAVQVAYAPLLVQENLTQKQLPVLQKSEGGYRRRDSSLQRTMHQHKALWPELQMDLADRQNVSLSASMSIDDTIHMATDRPHMKHVPLVKDYFM